MTGSSDDGQAGVAVTEADRETARRLLVTHGMAPRPGVVHAIAAALAAEREKARTEVLTEQGACGDLSPTFDVGSAALAPVMCNLPPGHKGAHCASDGTPFPMRWIRRAAEEGQQ